MSVFASLAANTKERTIMEDVLQAVLQGSVKRLQKFVDDQEECKCRWPEWE